MDAPAQDLEENGVVQTLKTLADIALNEPTGARPEMPDFRQGSMTAPTRPEAARTSAELRLIIRLQDQPYHFLEEFITPGRKAEGPSLPIRLGDRDPPPWLPAIAFRTDHGNDALDFRQTIGRVESGSDLELWIRSGQNVFRENQKHLGVVHDNDFTADLFCRFR